MGKQRITYKEKEIEMEQKSLTLKQQTLQAQYEMERLRKSFGLDKEEFKMGIKSKAELQVSEDEYKYKLKNTALQMESLKHDSSVTLIRKELLKMIWNVKAKTETCGRTVGGFDNKSSDWRPTKFCESNSRPTGCFGRKYS